MKTKITLLEHSLGVIMKRLDQASLNETLVEEVRNLGAAVGLLGALQSDIGDELNNLDERLDIVESKDWTELTRESIKRDGLWMGRRWWMGEQYG